MPSFETHQDSDLASFLDAANVCGASRRLQVSWVACHDLIDQVDELDCFLDGPSRLRKVARHIYGEKRRRQASLAGPGDIEMRSRAAQAQVRPFLAELHGHVKMGIDHDGIAVNSPCPLRKFFSRMARIGSPDDKKRYQQ